jgi:hypothetical protein
MNLWTPEETELLIKLYVEDELELLSICHHMKKKCKVIINKLLELKLVESKDQVRGTNNEYVPVKKISGPKPQVQIQEQIQVQNQVQIQSQTQLTSVLSFLNGINQIVNGISNIYESYNRIGKTSVSNPSK